jgi:acetolactate synthase-1/2/3 large subunit
MVRGGGIGGLSPAHNPIKLPASMGARLASRQFTAHRLIRLTLTAEAIERMKIQVSELIVRYMERLGVECIFGMPGAHILPVYDSLYDSNIQAVLAKHEQGAAFMAGGFIRASGKISACIATAGPGATNLITGVANAYADRQPLLVITGETPTHIFGKGGLQESSGEGGSIDQSALFKGITRYHKIVERTDYLPQVLNQASAALLSPNPGPVLLSLPFNVQKERIAANVLDTVRVSTRRGSLGGGMLIGELAELIARSECPVIIGGYGCVLSGAQQVIAQLSERMGIAVASSLKGKGIVSERSGLSLGSLGVTSGGDAYQYITQQADLIMVLGAGFNERTSYLWDENLLRNKIVVQVDSDPQQLEKVFRADIAINEDIRQVLEAVWQHIECHDLRRPRAARAKNAVMKMKVVENTGYHLFHSGFSLVEHFFQRLEAQFPDNVMMFDDNIIFAQNFYPVSGGNRYFPNSGVSSLGHAIPAAIGARFAVDKTMFAVLGDGGFQMCCMEIMTAVNYDKPLNIVMFNNETMGLIRKNQAHHYKKRYINCDFINPDYRLLAESFGIRYKKIQAETDLDDLFSHYDFAHGINLIEILIDKDAFPNYSSKR